MSETAQYRSTDEELTAALEEIRELEMMGEQISHGLAQEQRANAELRAENEDLRERAGGRGSGWPYPFNQTALLFFIQQMFGFAWAFGWGAPESWSFKQHVMVIVVDGLGQIGTLLWCIAIMRVSGFWGLAWRVLAQASGWAAAIGLLIWLHPDAPCTREYLISLAMPGNWWTVVNPLMPAVRDVVVMNIFSALTFDGLLEFRLSRKLLNVAHEFIMEATNGR